MVLPVATLLPDVIGLSDKDYHSAATFVCDWTVNSAINVDLSQTAFQGEQLKKKFNRLLINNATSNAVVTVSYLGISLTVNPYQQQNIALPDKVSAVIISGTSGSCRATLSNGGELIGDTLNAYQAQVTAGTNGLFAVNRYTASQNLTAADLNKTIILSAATPQNLTLQSIATPIANGALLVVENIGTATWTLTPNALDNFNEGAAGAAITIATGETLFVSCNGTNTWYYFRVGASTSRVLLGTLTTTSGTTQSLTGLNPSAYRYYEIEVLGVSFSGFDIFQVATSGNNGANYGTFGNMSQTLANPADTFDGLIWIYNINVPLQFAPKATSVVSRSNDGNILASAVPINVPKNAVGGTGAVNALQFIGSAAGTFDAGLIKVWGIL